MYLQTGWSAPNRRDLLWKNPNNHNSDFSGYARNGTNSLILNETLCL